MLIVSCMGGYQVQNYRNDCQELPITSELFATVYLLPPSQPIVDTLILCKWSPLLPVKELICDEKMREMNDGPRHAGRAAEDGENEQP